MPLAKFQHMISWLSEASGMDAQDVYSLASIAANFRITQYSNQTASNYTSIPAKTVHGMMPKSVFEAGIRQKISDSLRS